MITAASWSIFTQALGWTVIHSFWQIALIFLVFKAVSGLLNRHNGVVYTMALMAMSTAFCWSGSTFYREYQRIAATTVFVLETNAPLEVVKFSVEQAPLSVQKPLVSSGFSIIPEWIGWLEQQSAWLGWAWCLGVLLLSLRMLGGYWLARRLRYKGARAPDAPFQKLCDQWVQRLGIFRKVQLLESKYIMEPLTLGFWKPVVLFPAGMLLHLTPAQVEALLLHELAHVRRFDYLVNLVQLSLDTCFFYHPLFRLLSADARRRREYCCDDTVLRFTDDRLGYAHTLTEIKLHSIQSNDPFVMTAIGKSNFSMRMLRIAGVHPKKNNPGNLFFLLLLLTGLLAVNCWPAPVRAAEKEAFTSDMRTSSTFTGESDSIPKNKKVLRENAAKKKSTPSEAKVAIELNKMNVFYIGIDNPLRIAVDGVPAEQLVVRVRGNGNISGSKGDYMAYFTEPGETYIDVYRRYDGKETLLSSKLYRLKLVPNPIPVFCGLKGGSVLLEEIKGCQQLSALLENFDYDAVCNVVGFECTVILQRTDPVSVTVTGDHLPESIQEWIDKMTPGSAIFFDDIKVKCPGDAAARNVGGLSFKVKAAD